MTRFRFLLCLALGATLVGTHGSGSPALAGTMGGEATAEVPDARTPTVRTQLALGEAVGGARVGDGVGEAVQTVPAVAAAEPRQGDSGEVDPANSTDLADWADRADRVDRVVLVKSSRRLYLYRGPVLMRSYPVALGFEPEGPKRFQGDGRTPEGAYLLDFRKQRSEYYRSIHVSYPSPEDRANAWAQGHSPGGMIMIHGLPNGLGDIGADHTTADWTDGCVAVTNEEMDEIWDLIDDETPIHILP